MAIPKFEDDLRIISKLGDNPGTDNGYTTQEFKEAFDKAPLLIQKFINEVLIPAANASSSPEEGLSMKGPINMNGQKLHGLNVPTADDEAVNWGSVKNAAGVGIPLPLGLEYGGVGATDPKTARENLEITPENIGAMSMELLWENASPTSNFAEQTIQLNLRKYDAVRIVSYGAQATDGVTDMKESSFVVDMNTTGLLLGIRYYRFELFARSVSVSETGVHFELARYKGMGADDWTGWTQTDICIPLRIYGIKGVSV